MPASKRGARKRASGDAERLKETRRWLRYAREDLQGAEAIARDPSAVPRHACFFAQQAAEKALKAALVFAHRDFPLRHDLDRLVGLLPPGWFTVAQPTDLAELTEWAIEARYPGDLPEATVGDAVRAVGIARRVYETIAADLELQGLALDPDPPP